MSIKRYRENEYIIWDASFSIDLNAKLAKLCLEVIPSKEPADNMKCLHIVTIKHNK